MPLRGRITALVVGVGLLLQSVPVAANGASIPLKQANVEESPKLQLIHTVPQYTQTSEKTVFADESVRQQEESAAQENVSVHEVRENLQAFSWEMVQIGNIPSVVDRNSHSEMTTQTTKDVYGQVTEISAIEVIEVDANETVSTMDETVHKEPEIHSPIAEKEVTITRQEYAPYETVVKPSPLIPNGSRQLVREGETGIIDVTAIQKVDGNGEVVEETITERTWSYLPRSEVTLVGADVAVSSLDFGVPLDANGRPMGYSRLLRNQVATGYSARPGAKTASGMPTMVGHVAVNPNVIPYGSRLYIVSSDGSFVYGFAIAADTGTGLLQGIINVDLFYDTYQESALNGRKIVDIYVL